MKLKQWLYGATALAMLAACSDKDIAPGGGGIDSEESGESISGYMAIQINLPQETGTRADEGENDWWSGNNPDQDHPGVNDYYKDGESYEYKVDNACILLFEGAAGDERNATFIGSRTLAKTFFTNQPEDDNITSSYICTVKVTTKPTKNIFALVVLNRNTETFILGDEKITIAGKDYKIGQKFSELLEYTTANRFLKEDNGSYSQFFMTNAPLSNTVGGQYVSKQNDLTAANISYLADLGKDVYATEAEAKANLSGCVYVERAMAKVTYQGGAFDKNAIKFKPLNPPANASAYEKSGFTIVVEVEENDEVKQVEITPTIEASVRYALTHTNKTSYVIRNVEFEEDNHFRWNFINTNKDGVDEMRMVGEKLMPGLGAPFHGSDTKLYRTYWCKDPNYENEMADAEKGIFALTDLKDLNKPLYCKENTFIVKHQNYGNTTLAVFEVNYDIKGKYTVDGVEKTLNVTDIFVRDGDNSTVYVSARAAAAPAITRIISDNNIRKAMAACLKEGHSEDEYSVNDHLTIEMGYEDILNDDGAVVEKQLVINSISLKVPEGGDAWFDNASVTKFEKIIGNVDGNSKSTLDLDGNTVAEFTPKYQHDLLANANLLNRITVYKDGISYYVIPIKHFGDHYTPWTETVGETTDKVYDLTSEDHGKKYLGRYGMVRNNWYELNISEIRALGSGVIPVITDELSDDNKTDEKYFAVEIHILSWAKRNQSIKF